MAIQSIEIKNFKSIEYLNINIAELNAFVGKNGAGKTTILKAVKYFYENLVDMNTSNNYFDSNNFHKNTLEITLEFDLRKMFYGASGSFYSKIKSLVINNNQQIESFKVTMIQQKNSPIIWNLNYDERYIVYNSNPIYFCNTRSLSLTNWNDIWNVVGDLVNAKDANSISRELYSSLEDNKFKKFNSYTNLFENFLKSNNLSIHEYTKKEKIINLLQLQLGGKEFNSKEKVLDYFSDGTNSQNFILFLSYLSFEISRKRLKDVTVFLDEPELGLHPKMIDELMESIVKYSKNVKFVIFSHSSRLISYILQTTGELYNIYLKDSYTKLKKVIEVDNQQQKLIISEREASYFFSDFLFFVEGISEIELFTHKTIQSLFPILKKIDIINTNSNDHLIKLLLPKRSKVKIPYLVLYDLDKLVSFKTSTKKGNYIMKIESKWYSPLSDVNLIKKLKFNYSLKESKTYLLKRKKIDTLIEKEFKYSPPYEYMSRFKSVHRLINEFCLFNNIYSVETTIEGSIINEQSIKYIYNFYFKNNHKYKILQRLKVKDKVIIYRLLFNGKTDVLSKTADCVTNNNKIKKIIREQSISKNTGWITNFFDYYEKTILNQKQYQNDVNNKKKQERFSTDFPEIYAIIENINMRIEDE